MNKDTQRSRLIHAMIAAAYRSHTGESPPDNFQKREGFHSFDRNHSMAVFALFVPIAILFLFAMLFVLDTART